MSKMLAYHFNTHNAISIGKKYAVKVVNSLCVICYKAIRNIKHLSHTSLEIANGTPSVLSTSFSPFHCAGWKHLQ